MTWKFFPQFIEIQTRDHIPSNRTGQTGGLDRPSSHVPFSSLSKKKKKKGESFAKSIVFKKLERHPLLKREGRSRWRSIQAAKGKRKWQKNILKRPKKSQEREGLGDKDTVPGRASRCEATELKFRFPTFPEKSEDPFNMFKCFSQAWSSKVLNNAFSNLISNPTVFFSSGFHLEFMICQLQYS